MALLPVDLLHLLSEQLAREQDFPTLYSCVTSSRHFADAGAVGALYRLVLTFFLFLLATMLAYPI